MVDKQPVPLYVPWMGGPCPVDEDSFPQVITADGGQDCERASDFQWEWSDEYPADNVIAYRATDKMTLAQVWTGSVFGMPMRPEGDA